MKELIKYLNCLLVISSVIFLGGCDKKMDIENEEPISYTLPMTRQDSIIQLAIDLNIEFNGDTTNIHEILNKIINQKKTLVNKLDSLNEKANQVERLVYEYKKKEDEQIRQQLLLDIDQLKLELKRIELLAKEDIIIKDSLSIPEQKLPINAETLEQLKPGNYIVRIDDTHVVSIFINNNMEIFISEPKFDSTTVIRRTVKLNLRIQKELEQIKNSLKKK